MAWRFALSTVGVALALACDSAPLPTSSTRLSEVYVSGRVIDFQTNAGVSGQELEWSTVGEDGGTTNVTRVVSQNDGAYRVSLPAAGRFVVRGPGISANPVVIPTANYVTDFLVNVANCRVWYGIVLDADTRRPLAGARAIMSHSTAESITADNGAFRLEYGCGPIPNWSGTTAYALTLSGYRSFSRFGGRAEWIRNLGVLAREDILLTREP